MAKKPIKIFEPQVITIKDMKKAARHWYRNRRLTAQHPDPKKRLCVNVMGAYRCGFAAVLNKTVIKQLKLDDLEKGSNLYALKQSGLIYFPSKEDLLFATSLQDAHDDWADSSATFESRNESTIWNRRIFTDLIGLTKPKSV